MSISIRIIGEKRLAKEMASLIEQKLGTQFKEYPFYTDWRKRDRIDETKTRLYCNYPNPPNVQHNKFGTSNRRNALCQQQK